MNTILQQILSDKKAQIAQEKSRVSPSELFSQCKSQPPVRDFQAALQQPAVQIIAEFKKRSPSAGFIRPDADVQAICRDYERHGAAALSVLTETKYFAGNLGDLRQARESVQLPVLRKDFILDPYQVVQARAHGADAILLIVAALRRTLFVELVSAARDMHLHVLVEVHTLAELEIATRENARLIGINNRDLNTFTVDLDTTRCLLPYVPRPVTVVSESGIRSRSDVEFLAEHGVDAVLIGETLMRQPDPGKILQTLTGVKKCSR